MNRHDGFENVYEPDAHAGSVPCTLFGAALGLIFAVLCLTVGVGPALLIALFCLIGAIIGGVKDKKKFVENIYLFFHHDENGRY